MVAAEDINLDRMLAKGTACDAIFKIELSSPVADGLRIPRPEALHVHREGDTVRLWHRWFEPVLHLPLLGSSIVWMAFLIGWYSIANSLLFMTFPLVHVAVGLGMLWFVARGLLNRTEIAVTPHLLTGSSGPIAPGKSLKFHREAVVGVFVREDNSKYMKRVPDWKKAHAKATMQSYSVWVQLTGDREARLATMLRSKPMALFIEQELEDLLGLTPQAVYGEVEVPQGLRRRVRKPRVAGALAVADVEDAHGGLSER
ncbi:MAG: hypothetical protein ACI9U2_003184 [Bradymonadia bacterium]